MSNMRNDAFEYRLLPGAASRKRRAARIENAHSPEIGAQQPVRSAAIDEAFATLARNLGRISRLDAPDPPLKGEEASGPDGGEATADRLLWKQLAAQLEMLDRQREHLARLLHGADVESRDGVSRM